MISVEKQKGVKGFTIVELLIVIVVIGILAAITIVAFNGVQQKAAIAAIQSDLTQNAKAIMAAAVATPTGLYTTTDVMPGGTATVKFDQTRYKIVSYCANSSGFVLAAQTTKGDTYYTKTGAAVVQDNAVDAFRPCDSVSIGTALTTYLNLPALCVIEGGQCTFTGTATIAYGSVAQGRFTRVTNQVSPVTCSHAGMAISDPAPGFQKSCYVYAN